MRWYLAGRMSREKDLAAVAAALREQGHTVTSRWLNGGHKFEDSEFGQANFVLASHAARALAPMDAYETLKRGRAIAFDDLLDLQEAEAVAYFSSGGRSDEPAYPGRGGCHVEFGLALAWRKRLVLVGPAESIFHFLPSVQHVPDAAGLLRLAGNPEWEA